MAREESLKAVYTSSIGEAISRLNAADEFLSDFQERSMVPLLEASILQLRKSLELIAFAAIAPDKRRYAEFRATAEKDPDFTKDYHAAKIFTALSRINPDFYPKPLIPAERQPDSSWHFGVKQSGFLSQKRFGRAYDRLGKHLHAHNPWSGSKNLQNLSAEMPGIIGETRSLLALHARFVRTREFHGVWVVEAVSEEPKIMTAMTQGACVVQAG